MANKKTNTDGKKIVDIDISLIDINPDNEKIFGMEDVDYLARTIEEEGFVGAIEVYGKKDGRYEISSGHRRFEAAKHNGMKKIPCIVYDDVDDITKAQRLILSNIVNRKMSPMQWARALKYYEENIIEKKWHWGDGRTTDLLAKDFNMGAETVKRYLRLLKFIPEFQELLNKQNAPYSIFLDVVGLTPELQKLVYNDIVKEASKYIPGDGDDALIKERLEEEIFNLNRQSIKYIIQARAREQAFINRPSGTLNEESSNVPVEQFGYVDTDQEAIEEEYEGNDNFTIQHFEDENEDAGDYLIDDGNPLENDFAEDEVKTSGVSEGDSIRSYVKLADQTIRSSAKRMTKEEKTSLITILENLIELLKA